MAPGMMSEEMRNTVRLSQTIRQQQTNLIAAKHLSAPSSAESSRDETENEKPKNENEKVRNENEDLKNENEKAKSENEKANTKNEKVKTKSEGVMAHTTDKDLSDDPDVDMHSEPEPSHDEFARLANLLAQKRLNRKKPGPLKLSPGNGYHPAINSAPLRSIRPRMMPRYVQPIYGGYQLPYQVPYTAYPGTPLRRIAKLPVQRVRQERKKPVLDVFHGDITRTAPMPSQPRSARVEHFEEIAPEDRTDATELEMREMERKSSEAQDLFGSINMMDESVFKFKIFGRKLEAERKEKFMKICETSWDEFMAKDRGHKS